MASIQNVSELVESFVDGNISASEFANNFAPIFKSALKSQDAYHRGIALTIHSQISHYFNALISEDELKASVAPYGVGLNRTIVSIIYSPKNDPLETQLAFCVDERGELIPV